MRTEIENYITVLLELPKDHTRNKNVKRRLMKWIEEGLESEKIIKKERNYMENRKVTANNYKELYPNHDYDEKGNGKLYHVIVRLEYALDALPKNLVKKHRKRYAKWAMDGLSTNQIIDRALVLEEESIAKKEYDRERNQDYVESREYEKGWIYEYYNENTYPAK